MKLIKNFITLIIFCIIILTVPLNTFGKMYVETFVASGRIVDIRNNIITLDNGYSYLPIQEDMTLNVDTGQIITIRYIINNDNEKKYSELAPGKDSLEIMPPPDLKKPNARY